MLVRIPQTIPPAIRAIIAIMKIVIATPISMSSSYLGGAPSKRITADYVGVQKSITSLLRS